MAANIKMVCFLSVHPGYSQLSQVDWDATDLFIRPINVDYCNCHTKVESSNLISKASVICHV